MPQGKETTFFHSQLLPQEAFAAYFPRTYLPGDTKRWLLTYGRLVFSGSPVPLTLGGPSRLLVFAGAPGTGKTTLAMGLANELAKGSQRGLMLLSVKAEEFLSELEGKTPKLIQEAFRWVGGLAQSRDVVLLINELESLGYSRQQLTRTGDPSDLTRGTNTVLQALDDLPPQVLVACTTNFVDLVDEALVSRADLVVPIGLPAEEARAAILADTFTAYASTGLQLNAEDAAALAKGSEGLSGRLLRKSVWVAAVMSDKDWKEVRREDVAQALVILGERNGSVKHPSTRRNHDGGDAPADSTGSLQTRRRDRGGPAGNGHGDSDALALLG